jgi:hypothetical protein
MPPLEFWFEQGDSGLVVMHGPGIAVVFGGEHGIGHALCDDSRSGMAASGREDWLVKSAVFSDQEILEGQGLRIDNPVYQEVVPHGFAGETGGDLRHRCKVVRRRAEARLRAFGRMAKRRSAARQDRAHRNSIRDRRSENVVVGRNVRADPGQD